MRWRVWFYEIGGWCFAAFSVVEMFGDADKGSIGASGAMAFACWAYSLAIKNSLRT